MDAPTARCRAAEVWRCRLPWSKTTIAGKETNRRNKALGIATVRHGFIIQSGRNENIDSGLPSSSCCWVLQCADRLEMEQTIRLVILEHLRHQLDIHVLHVDLLQSAVEHRDCLIEFLLFVSVSIAAVV